MLSGWEGDQRPGGNVMAVYRRVHDHYVTLGLTAKTEISSGPYARLRVWDYLYLLTDSL